MKYYTKVSKPSLSKPNAVDLPRKVLRMLTPETKKHMWFDFEGSVTGKKLYFPLCVTDRKTEKPAILPGTQMTMTIRRADVESVEPYSVTTKQSNGIYWFENFVFFIDGTIIVSFTCNNSEVEGLEWRIKIESPKGMPENTPVPLSSVSAVASQNTSSNTNKRSIAGVSASSSSSSSSSSKKKKLDTDDDVDDAFLLESIAQENEFDIVLPYPSCANLSSKGRLQRKMIPQTVSGPVLSLTLPPALVLALLDDNTREKAHAINAIPCPNLNAFRVAQQPTVNDLFTKHLHRCKTHGLLEAEPMMKLLREGFEHCFESAILYTEEKQRLGPILKKLQRDRIPYSDLFGATYLLRYLISLVTLTDAEQIDPMTIPQKGSPRGAAIASIPSVDDNDADGNARSSALQRRSAVANRQVKSQFYHLEQVLGVIIKDLDEHAHYYFM